MPRLTPGRVLLTADAVGGVWRYVLELAEGLAARGAEPVIAAVGPSPSRPQLEQARAIARVVDTGLPLDWTADDERALADTAHALAAIAREERVDLAHLHAPAFAGWAPWPVPVVSVVHSCIATWWSAVRGTALPADFRWRANATGRGLRRSDAVIAPTEAFADAVRSAYALDRPITVVRNGRRTLGAAGGRPRERAVLAVGRLWDEGKNIATLDRACRTIGATVYAAGPTSGPNGAVVGSGDLCLLGELDETALWERYTRTAVLASPARYEPFGLSVLEAAQAGMALVLGNILTFRELWDGVAIFVEPDDGATLARVLRELLDDGRALDRMGDLARERARRYSAAAMVENTFAVHRAALLRTTSAVA